MFRRLENAYLLLRAKTQRKRRS